MFSTLFYILILFFQSIYAESNFRYNQHIQEINENISDNKLKAAFNQIQQLEKRGIFTNNDLLRMKRNLGLKIHSKLPLSNFQPRTLNEFVIRSLALYQSKAFGQSLTFCKNIIVQEPVSSDSMIKVFEILASQAPVDKSKMLVRNQNTQIKNIQLNEAMNLLDLMKRKEKTLF